jgi:hypothetical protein
MVFSQLWVKGRHSSYLHIAVVQHGFGLVHHAYLMNQFQPRGVHVDCRGYGPRAIDFRQIVGKALSPQATIIGDNDI